MRRTLLRSLFVLALTASAACGGDAVSPSVGGGGVATTSATTAPTTSTTGSGGAGGAATVDVGPSAADEAERAALEQILAACAGLDAAGFAARYAVPFTPALGYDPSQAANLDLVTASPFAPSAAEAKALADNGFVVSGTMTFPSFTYGYAAIYKADLPVYISADSILFAVHRSYDAMLEALETGVLIPDLVALLESMQAQLTAGAASGLGAEARADADLLVAVALGLARGDAAAPVAGASAAEVAALVEGATKAEGAREVMLFGSAREVDFSQFEPRGHYANENLPELARYFRAMMWLGRMDLRLLEAQPDGSLLFRRRQLDGALALRDAVDAAAEARWARVSGVVGAFVGAPDAMTLPEVASLLGALGVASAADVAALPDDAVAQAILDGGFGEQRVAGQLMKVGPDVGTLPLSRSFAVFPQRYTLDAHVLTNVSFSRVGGGQVKRMMPSPLDVAFAALGNGEAGRLLAPELATYAYAPDLCAVRVLADAHPKDAFEGSLYGRWLTSLRALSPGPEVGAPTAAGLPTVAATEPWARRVLSAQLASWAELRHDTILYAKPSYSDDPACEFPDGYVDPYPAFYDAIAAFAADGQAMLEALDVPAATRARFVGYFQELGAVAAALSDLAKAELAKAPLTPEQHAFLNQAVKIGQDCADTVTETGWYGRLFFDLPASLDWDPTIADVHTQPSDADGVPVGRVLHVGTGPARAMIVTVDACDGPRAYVGLASSYFELVTEDYDRLTDARWASQGVPTATDPPWLAGVVVH